MARKDVIELEGFVNPAFDEKDDLIVVEARASLITWVFSPDALMYAICVATIGMALGFLIPFGLGLASTNITSTYLSFAIQPNYDPVTGQIVIDDFSGDLFEHATFNMSAAAPCANFPTQAGCALSASTWNDKFLQLFQSMFVIVDGYVDVQAVDTTDAVGLTVVTVISNGVVLVIEMLLLVMQSIKAMDGFNSWYNTLIYQNGYNTLRQLEVISVMVMFSIMAVVATGVRDRVDVMLFAVFTLAVFWFKTEVLYQSAYFARSEKDKRNGVIQEKDFGIKTPVLHRYRQVALSFLQSAALQMFWFFLLMCTSQNYFQTILPFGESLPVVPYAFQLFALVPSGLFVGINCAVMLFAVTTLWNPETGTMDYMRWLESSLHIIDLFGRIAFLAFVVAQQACIFEITKTLVA